MADSNPSAITAEAADMAVPRRRGILFIVFLDIVSLFRDLTFGIINAVYGVVWFCGSVLLGALYDASILAVVLVSALLQAAALPVFLWLAARES